MKPNPIQGNKTAHPCEEGLGEAPDLWLDLHKLAMLRSVSTLFSENPERHSLDRIHRRCIERELKRLHRMQLLDKRVLWSTREGPLNAPITTQLKRRTIKLLRGAESILKF